MVKKQYETLKSISVNVSSTRVTIFSHFEISHLFHSFGTTLYIPVQTLRNFQALFYFKVKLETHMVLVFVLLPQSTLRCINVLAECDNTCAASLFDLCDNDQWFLRRKTR